MNGKSTVTGLEKTKIFFSQVKTETAKVTWPTKDQVKQYCIVVLVSTVVVCIMMGAWDWVLAEALKVLFTKIGVAG